MGLLDDFLGDTGELTTVQTREFDYPNTSAGMKKAKTKQAEIYHKYGFRPKIFKVTDPKTSKSFLVVVQAKGMKRIR